MSPVFFVMIALMCGVVVFIVQHSPVSLLRFKSCPESYANRDVAVLASKRKSLGTDTGNLCIEQI